MSIKAYQNSLAETLEKLGKVMPAIVKQQGKGIVYIGEGSPRYYPVKPDKLPPHLQIALLTYDPEKEILIVSDRDLSKAQFSVVAFTGNRTSLSRRKEFREPRKKKSS